MRPSHRLLAPLVVTAAVCSSATAAAAAGPGGAIFRPPPRPSADATLIAGRAIAPSGAPRKVRRVIAAANRIVGKPYRWGGGHRSLGARLDRGYDCSGAVSHALWGARLLSAPLDSRGLMRWGRVGRGRWITVYSSRSHAYVVVAGLRFDTGNRDLDAPPPRTGPRWSARPRPARGFSRRHPPGL